MSVAPELPPVVRIPARARRSVAAAQPGTSWRPASLSVVPVARARVLTGARVLSGPVRPAPAMTRLRSIVAQTPPAVEPVCLLALAESVPVETVPREFVITEPAVLNRPVWKPAQASQRVCAASSVSTVRLTGRGRVILGLLAAAIAGVIIAIAYTGASQSGPRPGAAPANVVVHDGDTLWSIARQVAPSADPRAEVAALQRLNHLTGVDLTPGQILRTR
ncbi:MAG: LysM peptidoglycan-binding domain-containing protein [Jatrophihabitans sp.]